MGQARSRRLNKIPANDLSATPEEQRQTSYHEAAHAVMYELAGMRVKSATAKPFFDGEPMRGVTRLESEGQKINLSGEKLVGYCKAIVAGDLASYKVGADRGYRSSSDQEQLTRVVADIPFSTDQVRAQVEPLAQADLDNPVIWSKIEALAVMLQSVDTVSGDDVRKIVESHEKV
jgi:hypothetical protein